MIALTSAFCFNPLVLNGSGRQQILMKGVRHHIVLLGLHIFGIFIDKWENMRTHSRVIAILSHPMWGQVTDKPWWRLVCHRTRLSAVLEDVFRTCYE
jgi:hypothetical protein